jgi:hypothetical protein
MAYEYNLRFNRRQLMQMIEIIGRTDSDGRKYMFLNEIGVLTLLSQLDNSMHLSDLNYKTSSFLKFKLKCCGFIFMVLMLFVILDIFK